jgi:hypothetical protein
VGDEYKKRSKNPGNEDVNKKIIEFSSPNGLRILGNVNMMI